MGKEDPALDSEPPKKKRAKKMTDKEREAFLNSNVNISEVQAHRVRCTACRTWVQLHKSQNFKLENWTQHEGKCPNITGTLRVRTLVKETRPDAPVSLSIPLETRSLIGIAKAQGGGSIFCLLWGSREHKQDP